MPYCTQCGKSVTPSDLFCDSCGKRLPSQTTSITSPYMESPVASQSTTPSIPKNNASPPLVPPSGFRKCSACGNTIFPGDKFCRKCLVRVKDPLPNTIPLDDLPPPPRQVFR